jgi:DNA-binding CsgD family transcriptional regulator
MKTPVYQQLPAGLSGEDLEVYAKGDELYALYCGTVMLFVELPERIKDIFINEMIKDKAAVAALVKLNITEEDAMLRQYVWCNYGGWNRVPDYTGAHLTSEYWDCGCRGCCLFEGKICKAINADGEVISKRELEIIKLVASGLADKEIAYELGITYNTAAKHRVNIEKKIHARSKVDITVFAHKFNIVPPDK